jgi:hypothetical protein
VCGGLFVGRAGGRCAESRGGVDAIVVRVRCRA